MRHPTTAFSAVLLTAANLVSYTVAQLPRECFFVEDLHGIKSDDSLLLSNLPSLMSMYKPGMQVSTVLAVNDEIDDTSTKLAGIGVKLENFQEVKTEDGSEPYNPDDVLELPYIQEIGNEWRVNAYEFLEGPPDRINIRVDNSFGVCDVLLYHEEKEISLTEHSTECPDGSTKDTVLRLPSDTPLVGFHGMVNMLGMTSLGVILVDTLDPVCQKPLLDDSNMWMYQAMDDFTAAQQTEGEIS